MSEPAKLTDPECGRTSPITDFSTVLLPMPLRPSSATTSPGATSRLMLRRT